MEGLVTIESILAWMKNAIETKSPISGGQWLDAAAKLNVLLMDFDEELIEAKFAVGTIKAEYIAEGVTAAAAKILSEARPDFKTMLLAEKKRERIVEFIRIAKKRTELQSHEM